MRERFFVFFFPAEREIEELLNVAIYFANPREKWPAHVTVRGPYQSRRNFPKRRSFHQVATVSGVDQFRSATQNTIFLRVQSPDLRSVWHKPHYGYNPHMTIYDGEDSEFADLLYAALSNIDPHFSFLVKELERVKSVKGQNHFGLYSQVNFDVLPFLPKASPSEVYEMRHEDRVTIVAAAIRAAEMARGTDVRAVAAG